MEFEWDDEKQQANIRKHGVDFAEASTVFGDPLELTVLDPDHSFGEQRFVSVGMSARGRVLAAILILAPGYAVRRIFPAVWPQIRPDQPPNPSCGRFRWLK